MTTMPDQSPDPDEVLQIESPEPAVTVEVSGPVRVQSLPRVSAGIRGRTVGTTPVQLLTADPHRAAATVITQDVAVTIAGSKQEVLGGQPGTLPPGTLLQFGASDELWAASAGADTVVTVIQERWANG